MNMIKEGSESNFEEGRDRDFYLGEEVELTQLVSVSFHISNSLLFSAAVLIAKTMLLNAS